MFDRIKIARINPSHLLLSLAIGLGVGLRLYLAYAYFGNYDQASYEIVVQIMRRGGNLYAETARYNYAPLWAYGLLALSRLADWTNLPFHFAVRGFLTSVDLANGILVGLIAARLGKSSKVALAAYLLNPVMILIVGFHGQFDNLAVLPLLAATYLCVRRSSTPPLRWIWLLGTLSILLKHITVFGVWMLFVYAAPRRRALIMALASALIFLAAFLPFAAEGRAGIIEHVFLYQGTDNSYGLRGLLPDLWGVPALFGLMLLSPFIAKSRLHLPLIKAMEFSFVAFLALTPGTGEQYFILPAIWGSPLLSPWHWVYTLAAAVFLAGSPRNIHLPLPWIWNTVWLTAAIWLLSYFVVWRAKASFRAARAQRSVLHWLLLAVILLVAVFLRVYQLDRLSTGPYYDDAANSILLQMRGGLPTFIQPFSRREFFFDVLGWGMLRLIGNTTCALRLTSALVGVASAALTYWLAREMCEDEPSHDPSVRGVWGNRLGLFAAALVATSLWQVTLSRSGFRAVMLPLLQSALLLTVWRGLRLGNRAWTLAAWVCGGFVVYAYLAAWLVPWAMALFGVLLLIGLRLARSEGFASRVRPALFILMPVIAMLPDFFADPVALPPSLRGISLMPLIYFVPAFGLVAAVDLTPRTRNRWWRHVLVSTVLLVVLGGSAVNTFQNYFARRVPQLSSYYENNEDIADLARYLGMLGGERKLYVGVPDYRDRSAEPLARNVAHIKWMQGSEVLVFPPGPAVYAWPRAVLPEESWLARFLQPQFKLASQSGPDGSFAYLVYARENPPQIAPSHPLSASVGGVIQLMGYDVLRERPSGGKTDVAIYWRVLRKAARDDYTAFITLEDSQGMRWAESGSAVYPSAQWEPGEIVAERVRVQTEDGTPPGQYWLKVGWWSAATGQRLPVLNEQGQPMGTTVSVGPFAVTRRIRPLDASALNIPQHLNANFGGLVLLGFDQYPASVRPAEPVFLTLNWQARSLLPDRVVTLQLRSTDQRVIVLYRGGPVRGTYPTSQWIEGEFIVDRIVLRIPLDAPAGAYALEVSVDDFPAQMLGRVNVEAVARNWTPPVTSHPMSITLGAQITLVGYDVEPRGNSVEVKLHWQAAREMSENYTVFAHLVDTSGAVRAQHDGEPVEGTYPTTLWQPGEFVNDTFAILLPPDLPPGDYTLHVGMYIAETGMRLPAAGDADRVVLGPVSVGR